MIKRVICAGDILYDFISTEKGQGLAGSTLFEKKQGGSPFNIAIGLARLGVPVGFLVKIGDDEFGAALKDFLAAEGVDSDVIVDGPGRGTTLAMAAVDREGKVEFRFYRENSADISLTADEIPPLDAARTSAIMLGSIAIADNPVGEALIGVYENMRERGVLTALDPNVRPLYVDSRPIYRERVTRLMRDADVLKLSDDDLFWLAGSGSRSVDENLARIQYNKSGLVIVTEGSGGARALWRGGEIRVPGYRVEVAETTGCGDAFMAGILSKLAPLGRTGVMNIGPDLLRETVKWANACAAMVATRYGAASSMPRASEVEDFMRKF
ncbi:MAG: carbohydrate kinase [Synergistaceae bacterium]|nr:carbohydrate kinase [Synergistaceae bacterium]